MNLEFSKYQQDIFDFVKYGYGNAVVEAVAGAGKSFSIVECLKYIKGDKRVLFLAFNNAIVESLKGKITREKTDVKTLHSLGYSILKYNFKSIDIKIDELKYKKKLNTWLDDSKNNNISHILTEKNIKKYKSNILKLTDLGRSYLVKNKKQLEIISIKHNIVLVDNEIDMSLAMLTWAKNSLEETNTIDFGDMLYLPNVLPVRTFKYDFIIVDEAQDLSYSQLQLFLKNFKQGGRFLAVGDKSQCQPAGTKILMASGEYKKIEDVCIDDKVTSYDRHDKGQFVGYYKNHRWGGENMSKYGYNVNNISSRLFNGDLVVINSNNNTSKYTPDHRCMVRFSKESITKHILYIMEKDGLFRIGISPVWSSTEITFASTRARGEAADKFWILDTYDCRNDAYLEEQFYSVNYSLPQMIFTYRSQKGNTTQNTIDGYYDRFDKDILKENAITVLNIFKRKYEMPFWAKNGHMYFSKNHMFEINACNVLHKIMEMICFDEINTIRHKDRADVIKPTYCKIDDFFYEEYNDYVYSLEIDKHELYVADGILTHNCIYGFSGSDTESFNKIKSLPSTISLPLSICYRCPKRVIELAKKFVPEIEARKNAPEGYINYKAIVDDIKDGDMIICRNTLPLVKLYLKLISEDKKAFIKGKDIGLNLIDLIKDIDGDELNTDLNKVGVFSELYLYLLSFIEQTKTLLEINETEVFETQEFNNLLDSIECLEIVANGLTTKDDLIDKLTSIFKDNNTEGICLSTIHKAKGLEADNVYVLNKNLMPSKYVKQDWELEQEKNLEYVAYTRPKKMLGFIYSKDELNFKTTAEKIIEIKYLIEKL